MDKYLKMFKPAMTKWLRDHYPLEEAKKRWKKTVYLDEKRVFESAMARMPLLYDYKIEGYLQWQ